jgi:hypothetical protein
MTGFSGLGADMTDIMQQQAAAIRDRVGRELRYRDPATGAPLGRQVAGALSEQEYAQQQARHEERRQRVEQQELEREESAHALRKHHDRERAELQAFLEVVAKHFGCPEMAADFSGRLRIAFQELRHFAQQRQAEASRRAVDPSAPSRDASGRFTRPA